MKRMFTVGSDQAEPIEFLIVGKDRHGNDVDPITFKCMPDVQGALLTDMVAAISGDDPTAAGEIVKFIDRCLRPEERQRFSDVIRGDDVIVQLEVLGEIVKWLSEVYGSRPTGASSGSPSGPSNNGPTLSAASSASALPTQPASPWETSFQSSMS